MGMGLLHSVSTLMAACSRRATRASRRLRASCSRLRSIDGSKWAPYLSRRISMIPLRGGRKKKEGSGRGDRSSTGSRTRKRRGSDREEKEYTEDEEESSEEEEEEEEEEEVDGVWRRTILMGEKCQPLDFAGVIYYDNEGRRLPGLPPRSPLCSPLPGFTYPFIVVSEEKDR